MVDVRKIKYNLAIQTEKGKIYLNNAITNLEWEEQPDELAVRITATVQNFKNPSGGRLHQITANGAMCSLIADWGTGWQEIHRAVIFSWDYSSAAQSISITAYDPLIYLAKSEDDRFYKEGTAASAIIKDIAGAWNIPLGIVEGPSTKLAKQIYRGERLSAIIMDALEKARKKGGGNYMVRALLGKMQVIKPGENQPIYHFGADVVNDVKDGITIDDLVTKVVIYGQKDDEDRAPVLGTVTGQTRYGTLQKILRWEDADNPAAAKAAAQDIIDKEGKPKRTARVVLPDLPFLRRGDKIHLTAGTINGYCLVAGVSHNANTKQMTCDITPA